jgi:hypothetical protein
MVPAHVLETIDWLDGQIAELKAARDLLARFAGLPGAAAGPARGNAPAPPPVPAAGPNGKPRQTAGVERIPEPAVRLKVSPADRVAALLKQRGPMRRIDIQQELGLSEAGVTQAMRDPRFRKPGGKFSPWELA